MVKRNGTRMYEPWGYQDQDNYQGSQIILENDLDSFFSEVQYNRDDNKIHFENKDGEEVASLDVSEFVKSDQIVEKAWYEDGKIYIKFTNGDLITIDVKELIDENEFTDGLQINDGVVSVLIDASSDEYLSVSETGVKLSGVKDDIEAEEARATAAEETLDAKINAEETRAKGVEDALDTKIVQEIADREASVNAEEARATAEETTIKNTIGGGFSTASTETITAKFNNLSAELDDEIGNRTTQDNQLQNSINNETVARQGADTRLENLITDEKNRAKAAEEALDNRIDEIISGSPIDKLDELIEKLGYKDNDTLVTTNEHEVAFGEYNISHTSEDASGQTIFSVGNGTSESEKSNAIEIMKNGDVYLWVEGDFMNINKLLGQLAHEVYDTDSTHNSHFFDGGN